MVFSFQGSVFIPLILSVPSLLPLEGRADGMHRIHRMLRQTGQLSAASIIALMFSSGVPGGMLLPS